MWSICNFGFVDIFTGIKQCIFKDICYPYVIFSWEESTLDFLPATWCKIIFKKIKKALLWELSERENSLNSAFLYACPNFYNYKKKNCILASQKVPTLKLKVEASSFKIRPNGYDVIQPFFLFYKISKFKLSTTFHKSFPIFSQVFIARTLAETELFERVRYGRPSLAGALRMQRKEREKWTRRGITRLCRGRRGPLGSSPTRSQTFQLVIAGCRLLSCRRSLASEPVSLSLSFSLYPFLASSSLVYRSSQQRGSFSPRNTAALCSLRHCPFPRAILCIVILPRCSSTTLVSWPQLDSSPRIPLSVSKKRPHVRTRRRIVDIVSVQV